MQERQWSHWKRLLTSFPKSYSCNGPALSVHKYLDFGPCACIQPSLRGLENGKTLLIWVVLVEHEGTNSCASLKSVISRKSLKLWYRGWVKCFCWVESAFFSSWCLLYKARMDYIIDPTQVIPLKCVWFYFFFNEKRYVSVPHIEV